MSTLEEIKAAAAELPVSERSDLVTWLNEAGDVYQYRREALKREIQIGRDAVDKGEFGPLDMEEIKREGRAILKQRGH